MNNCACEYRELVMELSEALAWAIDQIEDDLDLDHRAAMGAAWAAIERARQLTGEHA